MPLSIEANIRSKQLSLNLSKGKRGGRRPGSGRTRIHSKGVAHRIREEVSTRVPMHINFNTSVETHSSDCRK